MVEHQSGKVVLSKMGPSAQRLSTAVPAEARRPRGGRLAGLHCTRRPSEGVSATSDASEWLWRSSSIASLARGSSSTGLDAPFVDVAEPESNCYHGCAAVQFYNGNELKDGTVGKKESLSVNSWGWFRGLVLSGFVEIRSFPLVYFRRWGALLQQYDILVYEARQISIPANPPMMPVLQLLVYFDMRPLSSIVAPNTLSSRFPIMPPTMGTSSRGSRVP